MFNHSRPQYYSRMGAVHLFSIMTSHLKTEVDRIRETSCVSLSDIFSTVDSVQLHSQKMYLKQEEKLKCRLCFRCVFAREMRGVLLQFMS
jgi:hypothetical protein